MAKNLELEDFTGEPEYDEEGEEPDDYILDTSR